MLDPVSKKTAFLGTEGVVSGNDNPNYSIEINSLGSDSGLDTRKIAKKLNSKKKAVKCHSMPKLFIRSKVGSDAKYVTVTEISKKKKVALPTQKSELI